MTKRIQAVLAAALGMAVGCASVAQVDDNELANAVQAFNDSVTSTQQMLINSPNYVSEVGRAEAHRYLSGAVLLAHRTQVQYGADPAWPLMHQGVAYGNDWGFSNPDALYQSSVISSDYDYMVEGKFGKNVNHVVLGSFAGIGITSEAGPALVYPDDDIQVSDKGKFELVVAVDCGEYPGVANCLEMHPDASSFAIRQVFDDWKAKKGRITIRRLGSEGATRPSLSTNALAARWHAAGDDLVLRVGEWLGVAEQLAQIPSQLPPEYPIDLSFVPFSQGSNTSAGSWFSWGHYDIPDGMALVLSMPAPLAADYWGFSIYNLWGEMGEFPYNLTSINNAQGSIDGDGMLRIVLSDEDPGVLNWVDTTGRNRGFANIRVKQTADPGQQIVGVYVPQAALSQVLASAQSISPAKRKKTLAKRQEGVRLRYAE